MTLIFGALAGLAALVCLADWRRGMFACVMVGFLVDPVRKLTPGQPVAMTAAAAIFVLITIAGALSRGLPPSLAPIYRWHRKLRLPVEVFIALVVIYAGLAYVNTGQMIIAVIGLLAYLSVFPALLIGFSFGQNVEAVVRWLRFYLMMCLAMASGIGLAVAGVHNRALDQVGAGLIAFSPSGAMLELQPGFFRAPEIAGWHMATALCVTLILVMARGRRTRMNIATACVIVICLLVGILLTGRRKYLLEVLLFLGTYALLTGLVRKSALKPVMLLGVVAAAGIAAMEYLPAAGVFPTLAPYVERGMSAQRGGIDRARDVSIDAAQWIIAQNGLLGRGAGTGSQGVQHFVGSQGLVGGSAEGGFGKVLAELGAPGLFVFAWLLVAIARALWRVAQRTRTADDTTAHLCLSLMALLAAQVPLYGIAHQVFGDVFILLVLGWLLGFVLAMPAAFARRPEPEFATWEPHAAPSPALTARIAR